MNIIWLKRDLRLLDNHALYNGLKESSLVLYIFEPSISHSYDWSLRHWRFIYQSLIELQKKGLPVHMLYGESIDVFSFLKNKYSTFNVFSHVETGVDLTFKRDLKLKKFFKTHNIKWHEFQSNMVIRGLKDRATWDAQWIKKAKSPLLPQPDLKNASIDHPLNEKFKLPSTINSQLKEESPYMRQGGEDQAWAYLNDFLENKINQYWGSISYPDKSRYFTSFLSAYISWGNLSIAQIYQECDRYRNQVKNKISLKQFQARLKWHCHFIQKLEMQPEIEYLNMNPAFNGIRKKKNKKLIKAWKEGRTGYPLIDAAMRCLSQTGHLNFRLRSSLVSFLTHLLWQPWQAGLGHLAREFLDYEPGIHIAQFQMQAGTTGVNTIRIYNPIKQSKEKDKDGIFIREWLPELRKLPTEYIHEPWKMTEIEQAMYQIKLGEDYPFPIVDFKESYKNAQNKLWTIQKSEHAKIHSKDILRKHTRRYKRKFKSPRR